MQNFRRNTGDLKNSKHNLKYNFIFQKDADQQTRICYLCLHEKLFIIEHQ